MLLTGRAPAAALVAAAALAIGGCGPFGGDDSEPGPPAGYVPPPRDLPELPRGEPDARGETRFRCGKPLNPWHSRC